MARGFKLVARGLGDLKKRYRPQRLSEAAPTFPIRRVKKILDDLNASQVYLFEGITGTGKTTVARILSRAAICECEDKKIEKPCLECGACKDLERSIDFREINVANFRKIDDVREIIDGMRYVPSSMRAKIYIFDEVHQLTPDSQQLLLKVLEDTPQDVIVFLCTTEKGGLKRTLIDRALPIEFKRVTKPHTFKIIDQVIAEAEKEITEETKQDMFTRADGSIRALLNLLEAYLADDYEIGVVEEGEVAPDVKELAKALMAKDWRTASAILKSPKVKKSPESFRIAATCYLRAVILNKGEMSNALPAAGPLGHLAGTLSKEPAIEQYNVLCLRCLRACYGKNKKS